MFHAPAQTFDDQTFDDQTISQPGCDHPAAGQRIRLTHHARARSQQRGIRLGAIEVLLEHGVTKISHGREVVFMDQASRRRARKALGEEAYAQIETRLDIYLVLTEIGCVLTCVHRDRGLRFKH